MINHWLRNIGSSKAQGDRGEHPLSRATKRQTNNYVGYYNYLNSVL